MAAEERLEVSGIFETVTLHDGNKMPLLGMGTDKITGQAEMDELVAEGLRLGYRHLDTADWYHNEELVGKAIKRCGFPRERLFITTKLNNPHQGYTSAKEACYRSLERLKIEYVDLYMIHWPGLDEKNRENRLNSYCALLELQRDGYVKSVGVCNFQKRHIEELIREFGVAPAVNQIERHPWQVQKDMIAVNRAYKIHTEAWAPLMRGRISEVPVLEELAKKYHKSIAQVVLRWDYQSGIGFIPKTARLQRLRENMDIFDFSLTEMEMRCIDAQDCDFRLRYHPDTMDVDFPAAGMAERRRSDESVLF